MNLAILRLRRQYGLPLLLLLTLLLLLLPHLPEASSFSVDLTPRFRRGLSDALGGVSRPAFQQIPQHLAEGPPTRPTGATRAELHRHIALRLNSCTSVPLGTAAAAPAIPSDTDAAAVLSDEVGETAVVSPAAKAAADIETAYTKVIAAAAAALTSDSLNNSSKNSTSRNSSHDDGAGASRWWTAARSEAVEAARVSFLTKVADAFGLQSVDDASGVVYVHNSSSGSSARLLVDRQLLLRLRGEQQKGSWSLHFLGTGAMQASATRGTSCILFSRGDGSAWLFDCGGGPSPTHAATASRRAPAGAGSVVSEAGAVGDPESRLQRAVAVAVAEEAIMRTSPEVAAVLQQQHQQETRKRRMGVVQRVFVTHLHGDHCLGLPAFLSQIAQDPEEGPRHIEIVGPEGLRNLLRCILHGTSARRLPSFSVVELRAVPHLHHRRSRSIRLPFLPPAPSETVGRGDIEPNADGSYVAFEDSEILVTAAPIRHLVPCVGYVLTEKKSRHRLRADVIDPVIEKNYRSLKDLDKWPQLRGEPKAVYKARPLLAELKPGDVFTFPDGTQVGHSDIFLEAPHPRKICFAFDTCDASRLLPFAHGADILVHEATMSGVKGTSCKSDPYSDTLLPLAPPMLEKGEGLYNGYGEGTGCSAKDLMGSQVQTASEAAFERGHSSAAMAGSFAFRAGAARLVLTHFSQRYRGDPALRSVLAMERVEDEARRAYDIERQLQNAPDVPPLKVTAAWDGLAVVLPQRPHLRAEHARKA
ncbi:Zinc phosphodiesterase ELAC protein 1, related [Eimeria mitis]|uniref:Zinc phosphodiesterase ELAC protein 1, related n=1 Tax=Eimeria mitis TaxID=44415 RepID=U6K623_9EIME|nr:Zinc phosphodiesterase ELAC protein 1, related [Eimeria mitis]CDJ31657.1 Zinc phosphodiesterase ELAC protein 1, related [Eimeria mitis]